MIIYSYNIVWLVSLLFIYVMHAFELQKNYATSCLCHHFSEKLMKMNYIAKQKYDVWHYHVHVLHIVWPKIFEGLDFVDFGLLTKILTLGILSCSISISIHEKLSMKQ